jgi:hypothetical protein
MLIDNAYYLAHAIRAPIQAFIVASKECGNDSIDMIHVERQCKKLNHLVRVIFRDHFQHI